MHEGKKSPGLWERLLYSRSSRRQFLQRAGMAAGAMGAAGYIDYSFLRSLASGAAGQADGAAKICRNTCPRNCYDTCSILSYVADGILRKVEGDPEQEYTDGRVCIKGYTYTQRVYSPDRIKYPMKQIGRNSGKWQRISWDEAMTAIASKILELKQRYGSTLPVCLDKYSGNFGILHYCVEGMFSSIGYTTRALGTPCWPSGLDAQIWDFGGFHCSDPSEIANAKYLILWGVNPAWTAIHSMRYIYEARAKGAKIVVIDPILTATASKADLYVQIKTSTDGALSLGMARYILDHGLYDAAFLANHVHGWEEMRRYLENSVTLSWAAETTGVPEAVIAQLAEEYARTKPALIWIGYGMQRHINGGQNVRAIDALAAITGNIGLAGGGAQYAHLDTWGFSYHAMSMQPPAGSVGVTGKDGKYADRNINMNNFAAEIVKTQDPPIKMLWFACRNPLSQDPDTAALEKALEGVEMIVTVDHFINRSAQFSDIVLPATTNFESADINAGYWHHWVSINERAVSPMYESKSDLEIAWLLSKKMNELAPGSCTYPTGGDEDEWVAKEFNDGMAKLLGISDVNALREKPRRANLPRVAWADRKFATASGKYDMVSEPVAATGLPAMPVYVREMPTPPAYPYRFLTPHPQYAIHSQFQNLGWMMSSNPRPLLEIHPDLAAAKGIKNGDKVKVFNDLGAVVLEAKISRTVPPDAVVTYESWYRNSNFNVNYTVHAIATDMGEKSSGNKGMAFHDNFVDIARA